MKLSRRLATFGVLALLLGAAILYSRAIRRVYFLDDLQYAPKENELLLITGDVESLWRAVDFHFGEQIREDEASPLYATFRELRETLERQGAAVGSVKDLAAHGLDVGRGLLLSTTAPFDAEHPPLVLAHLTDAAAFRAFLSALVEEELVDDATLASELFAGGALRADEMPALMTFDDGSMGLVLPTADPGAALLAPLDDRLPVRRAVLSRRSNRAHAFEMDALFDGIRRRLGRPPGSGPDVFAFWRPRSVAPLVEVAAAASLATDEIRVEADVEIAVAALRVADDLLAAPPEPAAWAGWLPPDTAAVVVVQDRGIAGYLRFLSLSPALREGMDDFFAGILPELRGVSGLRRVLLAVTGYRDGLPELTLGIWGDGESLERLVETLQRNHRDARDRFVLEQALEAYRLAHDGKEASGVADLEASGLLDGEADPGFERFAIVAGVPGPADPQPLDFRVPSYEREVAGRTIRYLLPPVTANDLRYVEEYREADAELLAGDRYRMASVVAGDALWISTDLRELEELLDRQQNAADDLTGNPAFRVASERWTGEEKIVGFVDVDRATTLGLLSPESGLEEGTKQVLGLLKDHPAVSLRVVSAGSDHRLVLTLRLVHRTGMVRR